MFTVYVYKCMQKIVLQFQCFPHYFLYYVYHIMCLCVRLRVKDRMVRVPPGYQAELVIQLLWVDGEPPQQITSLDINSAYGL